MEFSDLNTNKNDKWQSYEDSCYEFFKKYYEEELLDVLQTQEDKAHYPFLVDYIQLFEELPIVGELLLTSPDMILERLDKAAKRALIDKYEDLKGNTRVAIFPKEVLKYKLNIHVRIHTLPVCAELHRLNFPSCKESGSFLCLIGTVVRVSTAKLLENTKTYQCNRCKNTVIVKAQASRYHAFPRMVECCNLCPNAKVLPVADANSKNAVNYSQFRDYQEIKLQEQVQKMDFGSMPKAITVILEDDLVNSCKPGDDVTITGTLYLRWKPFKAGLSAESELVCRANFIQTNNDQRSCVMITDEMSCFVTSFWKQHKNDPFAGRNRIISSFCPQIYGMYVVKLAMCMILAGGVSREVAGTRLRGESHMLLVGDPGTGKSQLLKYASKISPRSVLTTGIGTSSAGLTVSAVKDNGEWHLEAGALVLADGGVCCIDEFSCIKEHDRTSIHEAMEQQSISIAKAGMVVKLPTRVTMIAATNPKGKYDPEQPLDVNIAIASPLLSRFDILMVLTDAQNDDWDNFICDFILEGKDMLSEAMKEANSYEIWDTERLQSYLVHIKKLEPEMSNDANLVISQYYQYQRCLEQRQAARTTVRLLESLRRLSEGHARLMYRNKVVLHDAITAISLIEASMQSSSIFDAPNSLHTAFPNDAMEEYRNQAQIILQKLDLTHLWEKERDNIDNLKALKAKERMSSYKTVPGPSIQNSQPIPITRHEQTPETEKIVLDDDKMSQENSNLRTPSQVDSPHRDLSENSLHQNKVDHSESTANSSASDDEIGYSRSQNPQSTNYKKRRVPSSSSSSSDDSFILELDNQSDDDLFGPSSPGEPLFQSSAQPRGEHDVSQQSENDVSLSSCASIESKKAKSPDLKTSVESNGGNSTNSSRKNSKNSIRNRFQAFKRTKTDDD